MANLTPSVETLVRELIPKDREYGWSNEGMLDMLENHLTKNPSSVTELYEFFKSFKPIDEFETIAKETMAACLINHDKSFKRDLYDYLRNEVGWEASDFEAYEAYKGLG